MQLAITTFSLQMSVNGRFCSYTLTCQNQIVCLLLLAGVVSVDGVSLPVCQPDPLQTTQHLLQGRLHLPISNIVVDVVKLMKLLN